MSDGTTSQAKGWAVVLAGLGINLALGVLYTWSIIAKALSNPEGVYKWTAQQAAWPYTFAVGVFALTMVFAGKAQDRFGPRWVATAGGVLVGLGMIVSSMSPTSLASKTAFPTMMVVGFGIMTGMGIGLAYASATPAAVKWFHPSRKGLITGIVVGGFGLASVYTAPLTQALIGSVKVSGAFMYLGIGFLVAIVLLAQLLNNPPAGYTPVVPEKVRHAESKSAAAAVATATPKREYTWQEMMKTPQFYLLWLMYAFAAFAGLMIVGIVAKVAAINLGDAGKTLGFVLVATLAIGNGAGRPLTGILSDRIGRTRTMIIVFLAQAILVGWLIGIAKTVPFLLIVGAGIGFMYGANLTLFPAATYDFFGTKNAGVNYGIVFTAWGIGGVFGSQVAAKIVDATGSYGGAYTLAAVLCILAAGLTLVTKAPKTAPERSVEAAESTA